MVAVCRRGSAWGSDCDSVDEQKIDSPTVSADGGDTIINRMSGDKEHRTMMMVMSCIRMGWRPTQGRLFNPCVMC